MLKKSYFTRMLPVGLLCVGLGSAAWGTVIDSFYSLPDVNGVQEFEIQWTPGWTTDSWQWSLPTSEVVGGERDMSGAGGSGGIRLSYFVNPYSTEPPGYGLIWGGGDASTAAGFYYGQASSLNLNLANEDTLRMMLVSCTLPRFLVDVKLSSGVNEGAAATGTRTFTWQSAGGDMDWSGGQFDLLLRGTEYAGVNFADIDQLSITFRPDPTFGTGEEFRAEVRGGFQTVQTVPDGGSLWAAFAAVVGTMAFLRRRYQG